RKRGPVVDDLGHEADPKRLLCLDDPAGEDQVETAAEADDPRQSLRAAVDQRHAPASLGEPEARPARGDPQVAPQRQLEPARQAPAFDRGDRRLRGRQPGEPERPALRAQPRPERVERLEVGAGAERDAAGAGQHQDPSLVVGHEPRVALGERVGRRPVHRVAPLGPVDREDGRGAAALVGDGHRRSVKKTPPAGSSRGRRWSEEGTRPRLRLTGASAGGVKARLPAAAPLGGLRAVTLGGQAGVLALLEPPHDQAEHEHEAREERDHDEADVGDDLVVGLAVDALAAVLGQRQRREGEEEQDRGGQAEKDAPAHRTTKPNISDVAVCIASDLGKDMAGEPLFRGVSFKLERRDRMTLSGRNGAGKTTLLRMLAGQASIDAGELVFAKGVKVSLHDQRPPRERSLSLREYVLSGAHELLAIERELTSLEQAMADGAHDEQTLGSYAQAQARLEHAGGYTWRERALRTLHGLGFRDDTDLDRRLDTFSGGELTRASLARALAGDPDLLL